MGVIKSERSHRLAAKLITQEEEHFVCSGHGRSHGSPGASPGSRDLLRMKESSAATQNILFRAKCSHTRERTNAEKKWEGLCGGISQKDQAGREKSMYSNGTD